MTTLADLRARLPGLGDGEAVVFGAIAASVVPPPPKTVDHWAEERRVVAAEAGSPQPGPFRHDLAPHLREIEQCLSFSHPCQDVVFVKSAQVAGTEGTLNLIGYCIDHEPAPVVALLPTLDEAKRFNKTKLQPTLDATPALRHRVRDERARSEAGSTATFKKFAGGYLQVTGANAARGLQMISGRVLVAEEISSYPEDVDNRGDPLEQAENRLLAWDASAPKRYYVSTPGIRGACRVTARYERGDQRLRYVPCPHCGQYQVLVWEHMRWRSDAWPHRAYFPCQAPGCGQPIEHHHKDELLDAGVWLPTWPDDGNEPGEVVAPGDVEAYRNRDPRGRQPSFAIWTAYAKTARWDSIVAKWLHSKDDPTRLANFVQQWLGRAWEETAETPDAAALVERRELLTPRQIPPDAPVLTGMVDVQGNRLEYAVYAWGPGLTGYLIDRGQLDGDPAQPEVWRHLADVVAQSYPTPDGVLWPVDAWGVDAGYMSQMVYQFARGRPGVCALDGRPGWHRPFIGSPSYVDIRGSTGRKIRSGAKLWPTGTFSLKSWVYGALRKTIDGPDSDGNWQPGALHFPVDLTDREFFDQITAEYLADVERRSGTHKEWLRAKNRPNEQLDLVVGARALAFKLGLDRYTHEQWARVFQERMGEEPTQPDLGSLWMPKPGDRASSNDGGEGSSNMGDLAKAFAQYNGG